MAQHLTYYANHMTNSVNLKPIAIKTYVLRKPFFPESRQMIGLFIVLAAVIFIFFCDWQFEETEGITMNLINGLFFAISGGYRPVADKPQADRV